VEAREQRCDDGGDYRLNGVKKNDVAVRFTVQVPRNVPINASTVNGGLDIDGVSAPVEAKTVNGRIAVNTSTVRFRRRRRTQHRGEHAGADQR